jgi:hypothetical protein
MYTTLNGKAKRAEGGGRQNPCTIQKRRLLLNEHIKPETEAFANFKYDSTKAEELLKAGFEL